MEAGANGWTELFLKKSIHNSKHRSASRHVISLARQAWGKVPIHIVITNQSGFTFPSYSFPLVEIKARLLAPISDFN